MLDTRKLERDVRAKIERHVADLQAMLAATAGDTAHTRRLLEERADLTKSYSEALFDGCIKAVAARVHTMQRSNHQHMVEQVRTSARAHSQRAPRARLTTRAPRAALRRALPSPRARALGAQLTSIDEDILRLERALPGMRYYTPGHAAQRQAAGGRSVGGRTSRPRPYNPLARNTQMYAWDIRGIRPLPLVPVRHGTASGQLGMGRRGSRDLGSPISAVLQAGQMRSTASIDAPADKPRSLPKLVVVGEKQEGHVSKANVPRALAPAEKVNYGFPQGLSLIHI